MEFCVFAVLLYLCTSTYGIPVDLELVDVGTEPLLPTEDSSKNMSYVSTGPTWHFHGSNNVFHIYADREWTVQKKVLNEGPKALRSDYKVTPGIGAHKLHTESLTWNMARKVCIAEGGHLAVINSVEEEQLLLGMMHSVDGWNWKECAFVGVHDLFEKGEWVTITGELLEQSGYTRWSTEHGDQPNNLEGRQDCVCLHVNGGLNDFFCDDKERFFCEIPMSACTNDTTSV